MTIDKVQLSAMLRSAAGLLAERAETFSEIDSRFGDGDHGVTIGKIAKVIEERVSLWGDECIQDFLDGLGTAVMAVNGGSAGPLYGTMIGGLGVALQVEETQLDAEGVKRMFAGALGEMEDITPARVGDKTMMDALIPAVEAAQAAQGDAKAVLKAAAEAAAEGAKATEQYVSKFGRARSYKEQTIGTPDAGAMSVSTFILGLWQGL